MPLKFLSNLRGTLQSVFHIQPAGNPGAPVSGDYKKGDIYTDSNGDIYRCTASGNPGTWVKLGEPLSNHDHSGDAGDGGAIEASSLGSDSVADGYVLTANGIGASVWRGFNDNNSPSWYADGRIARSTTNFGQSYIVPISGYFNNVWLYAVNTGTAGSTIIDIHKNGTTVFTNQDTRPTLTYNDADKIVSSTPAITALIPGDILTFYIDNVANGARSVTCVLDIIGYRHI